MALPPLNPWLAGLHGEAASKRAEGRLSVQNGWGQQ